MKVLIDTIVKAYNENLVVIALLLISDFGTTILNIVLGTIQGTKKEGFDYNKFIFGFVKLFASLCIVFGFCYFVNLISLTVDLIEQYFGIQIFDQNGQQAIVVLIDVITIFWARIKDTCLDLIEKFKNMKTLKYIKYDDVQYSDLNDHDVGGIL